MGASMVAHNGRIYIFGGTDGVEPLQSVLIYEIATRRYQEVRPSNAEAYSMPICPILQPVS